MAELEAFLADAERRRDGPAPQVVDGEPGRAGAGITSICSAHPAGASRPASSRRRRRQPALIEATCNQVNQEGGYTGMTPAAFRDFVEALADGAGFPGERLILGGDHLGPNPWRGEPAGAAMAQGRGHGGGLCRARASARSTSTPAWRCAGDPAPLPDEVDGRAGGRACARRAEAPRASGAAGLRHRHRGADAGRGAGGAGPSGGDAAGGRAAHDRGPPRGVRGARAEAAWARVIAVVVQPGRRVRARERGRLRPARGGATSRRDPALPGLAYEAHSTDYQTDGRCGRWSSAHFAILKVGPGLTFALREAVFALDRDRGRVGAGGAPVARARGARGGDAAQSRLLAALLSGTPEEQRFAAAYSLSDRARYYWPEPAVQAAVAALVRNLTERPAPLPLLSQHLPAQLAAVR